MLLSEGSCVVYYVVYPLLGEFVFWMCDSYVFVFFSGFVILTSDLYAFELVHTNFYLK